MSFTDKNLLFQERNIEKFPLVSQETSGTIYGGLMLFRGFEAGKSCDKYQGVGEDSLSEIDFLGSCLYLANFGYTSPLNLMAIFLKGSASAQAEAQVSMG